MKALATQIVEVILEDLRDRKGIRQALDDIDDDIKEEMLQELTEKIEAVLEQ